MKNTPVVIEEVIGTALDITSVDYKSVMTKGTQYFEKKGKILLMNLISSCS